MYQIVDLRTDSFVQLGKMYNTTPGFYLLVGPDWQGAAPRGITKVFRSPTNTGLVGPRIAQNDTPEDKRAVQQPLTQVLMYPLADFGGVMKSIDWSGLPHLPAKARPVVGRRSCPRRSSTCSRPCSPTGRLFLVRRRAMRRCSRCSSALERNPSLKAPMLAAAAEVEQQVVEPLFEFRNYGQPLPDHWSTISNESAFGTDYFTRTAVAKSNILVNAPQETKYYYQDLDAAGVRLDGAHRYTVTFAKDQTPPVNGFWSLTMSTPTSRSSCARTCPRRQSSTVRGRHRGSNGSDNGNRTRSMTARATRCAPDGGCLPPNGSGSSDANPIDRFHTSVV